MLAETGIDTLDISFVDGSGLSPLNLATARAFVRWLEFLDRERVTRRTGDVRLVL